MKTLSLSALVALASGIQLAAADVCLPYILVYLKQIALNTGLTFYHRDGLMLRASSALATLITTAVVSSREALTGAASL